MQKLLVFLLFTLLIQPVKATVIRGNHIGYAGQKIKFYHYSDPVTQNKDFLFLLDFDENGNFKKQIQVDKIEFVFCEFGVYRGLFFLEPGKEVEILFPPLREKSFADKKNPYFEPISFWFASKDGYQLTDQISDFDKKFNELTEHFFNYLYFRRSKDILDSIVTILDNQFSDNISEVLEIHKKLKIKVLESDVSRLKAEDVSELISTVPKQYCNHPAFIELFDKQFSNRLEFEAKSVNGLPIRKAVADGDTNYLIDFLKNNYKLEGDATELVFLKMLHDGFYSGQFSQESILKMLHFKITQNKLSGGIKKIAENVINKLKFLMPDTKAPVICLKDIDGNQTCSDQENDRYKYLLFADTEMLVCREHLKYLIEIQNKFQKYLEIIIVLRKTDLAEMKMFLIKNQIPGLKLIDDEGLYIDKFGVLSFPVSFLLNKEHKVVFSHTKNPLDGFEQQFGPYLQKEVFMQQRN